ncbi:MAG: DNA-processing protein DprA [Thermoanaerobaculia bacterium]
MDRPPNGADSGDRDLLLALNAHRGLSRGAICRLAGALPLWRGARGANRELATRLSMDLDTLSKALDLRTRAAALADDQRDICRRRRVRWCLRGDEAYPTSLLELELPPPVLFYSGRAPATADDRAATSAGSLAIAIVGSRKATTYGIEVATWLARELAAAGTTIVSGFARGIDAAAHRGALQVSSGTTVAVLGCGLGVDYPRGQSALAEEIRERGTQLSEFPCDTPPARRNFPVRNRIIANLTSATVVVEAAPRSGSLVTARLALESGRDVFAVPGRITDELALGTNELLRDGAGLVMHPADLLETLRRTRVPSSGTTSEDPPSGLDEALATLFGALERDRERAVDELAQSTGRSIDDVLRGLLDLELAGHAKRAAGGGYRRA